ncbi:cysteine synthase family protein [Microcoleus sp. FACHB-68]|uniref:PLP-dependent cysteine synthase family protein n=1 Tax=Microcoleus sp. FACHB-68 TaxID=2692826 RepID=UPI0016849113|nr:cysteine synthase family protein [Microcoleus sp. FACHB-68]MBD1937738.1 cysteine synthase family protein [Microcoleus sp. FACHB-68]
MLQVLKNTPKLPLSSDITEAIGNVPIVRINRLSELCQNHEFYLKLESCNPGGSIKEKNALYLVQHAERIGLLNPGGTIVESSSGNFGVGLAMIGAARGYRVIVVVDAKTAPPFRRMLAAYGAEMVDVPLSAADANGSMQVARMQKAQELAQSIPGAWYPCQHRNPENPTAHEQFTAREIEQAFGGAPDVIVIGVSTAGQLGGISRFFKQRYPQTRIVGVDVAGSAIFGTPSHPYKMTGLGLSFVPPNFDATVLDAAYSVTDCLAFSVCHALARLEGLLLGASTGAIVAAALAYGTQYHSSQRMVLLNPDRGDRYLETVYNPQWLTQQGIEILSNSALTATIRALQPVPATLLRQQQPA